MDLPSTTDHLSINDRGKVSHHLREHPALANFKRISRALKPANTNAKPNSREFVRSDLRASNGASYGQYLAQYPENPRLLRNIRLIRIGWIGVRLANSAAISYSRKGGNGAKGFGADSYLGTEERQRPGKRLLLGVERHLPQVEQVAV